MNFVRDALEVVALLRQAASIQGTPWGTVPGLRARRRLVSRRLLSKVATRLGEHIGDANSTSIVPDVILHPPMKGVRA